MKLARSIDECPTLPGSFRLDFGMEDHIKGAWEVQTFKEVFYYVRGRKTRNRIWKISEEHLGRGFGGVRSALTKA